MNERDELRRAVLESPHDDLPRLIFADRIQEDGEDELAEFVRVQCELATILADTPERFHHNLDMTLDTQDLDQQRWKHEIWGLQKRENELWKVVGDSFDVYGMQSRMGWEKTDGEQNVCVVRRGFIDEIRLPLTNYIGRAVALFSEHPIERVILAGCIPTPEPPMGDFVVYRSRPDHLGPLWPIMHPDDPDVAFVDYIGLSRLLDIVSIAAVTYGRQQAGLGSLV